MESMNMKTMHRPFFSVLTGLSAGTLFLLSSCPSPSTTPPPPPNPREAAAPNFSLNPGTYFGTQTLEITSKTPGAVIRFVLQEGASAPDPTPESPAYIRPVELKEGTPGNPKSYTLSARTFKDGMNPSTVVRALYSIDAPKAQVVITPEGGNLYGTQQLTMSSPDGAEIRYEWAQGLAADGKNPKNPTREPIQGNVSEGSGSPIYDTSAASPTTITLNQGSVETPNIYTYWIRAFKDGLNPGDIVKLTFRVYPQKAGTLAPTLDAGNYRGNQTLELTLTPADPAADIVYTITTRTTDGSEPADPPDPTQDITSTDSTAYTATGIPLNAPAPLASDLPNIFIVKARAFAAGKVPGDILRLRYEIRAPKVEPVVIEDEPGDTFGSTLLKLSSPTPGAEIRYVLTNDGTEPADPVQGPEAAGGSKPYDPAAPPSIKPDALNQLKTFRIKARAFKPGFLPSDVSPVKSFPLKVTVKQVYAGGYHEDGSSAPSTLFLLLEDGSVWGVGDNRYGQLGNGPSSSSMVTTFTRVMEGAGKPLTNAKEVTGSWKFTAVLKNDGTVYTFGNNEYGQLGQGDTTNRRYAAKVNGQSGIVSIAAGMDHLILVNQSGSAFAAGRNSQTETTGGVTTTTITGQLATDTGDYLNASRRIRERSNFGAMKDRFGDSITNIVKAAAGAYHSLLLTRDGWVWASGENDEGQLGIGSDNNSDSLRRSGSNDGIGGLTDVKDVSGSVDNSMFVKTNGELWGAGSNVYGLLGMPRFITGIGRIYRRTSALKLGVYSSTTGELENAITDAARLPRGNHIARLNFYIDTAGQIHASGSNLYDQFPHNANDILPNLTSPGWFTQASGIRDVKSLTTAAGGYAVFLMADGSLKASNRRGSSRWPFKNYRGAVLTGNGAVQEVNPLK